MNKTITQNDLLLFAYNELDAAKRSSVLNAITQDPLIQEQLNEILEIQHVLETSIYSPHPTSLQIILEESAASALEVH